MPVLFHPDETGAEQRFPIAGDRVSIGRQADNDLVLFDNQVSRKHCVLERRGEEWLLTDLGSRFGTWVNDKPLGGTVSVRPGDRLRIGNSTVRFVEDGRVPDRRGDDPTEAGPDSLPVSVAGQVAVARRLAEQLLAFAKSPANSPVPAEDAARALLARLSDAQVALEDLERNQLLGHTIAEVGKLVNLVSDLDRALNHIMDLAVQALGAERGFILLREGGADGAATGPLVPRVQRNMGDLRGISTTIAEKVVEEGGAEEGDGLLTTDAQLDPRFMEAQSVMMHGIRAVMCVPLRYKAQRVIGAIYVDGRPGNRMFSVQGLRFLNSFAAQAAISIENARLAEKSMLEEERRKLLSRYFSEAVIDSIVQGAATTGIVDRGRTVTILFTDIRGFTSMMEKLRPADAVEMLNDYFTEIVDELLAEEGTLDKYTGDGIMAFWGAPKEQPDHALRAIRAALRMQARMPALLERWQAEGRSFAEVAATLGTGIGIHTGEAVVGNIGSPKRMEYTAIGDAVNLSARVQSVAEGGEVLVTAETLALVEGRIDAEPLPAVSLKGKSQAVKVFRVKGLR